MTWRRASILSFVAGAAIAVACGRGNIIIDVDLLSFQPSDTVPKAYLVPGGLTVAESIPPFGAKLLKGLQSKSVVDTVTLSLGAAVNNTGGTGTVKFKVFFGNDSLTVYSAPTDTASASANVTGTGAFPLGPLNLPLTADTLFASDQLWIGVKVAVSANAGPNMTGQTQLNRARLRVVLSDKIF